MCIRDRQQVDLDAPLGERALQPHLDVPRQRQPLRQQLHPDERVVVRQRLGERARRVGPDEVMRDVEDAQLVHPRQRRRERGRPRVAEPDVDELGDAQRAA
eukprot:377616-Prymnesium_polylepis.1